MNRVNEIELYLEALKLCKDRGLEIDDRDLQTMYTIAVMRDGKNLEHVREDLLTPELCTIAVMDDPEMFSCVKEEFQTPELCMVAVCQSGQNLLYVKNQTMQLCIAAMMDDPDVYEAVDDKYKDAIAKIFKCE